MTIAPSKISKTDDRPSIDQPSPSNINPARQYDDVSNIGRNAIASASNSQSPRSLREKLGQWFKSPFSKSDTASDKESIASSSSSGHNDAVISTDNDINTEVSPQVPASALGAEKLTTNHLVFDLFCNSSTNFDAQQSSKAAQQEAQLKSQKNLQRSLFAISNLPHTNLSQEQKNRANSLIQAVREEGVHCDERIWKNNNEKQNLEEEVRLLIDEKQANHPILTNQYTQITQTKNEFIQMCLGLVKSLHETAVVAARAIGK